MNKLLIIALLICFPLCCFAITLDSQGRDQGYVNSILGRSSKIVEKLSINDSAQIKAVTHIIANRYFKLNDIYEKRDNAVKQIKESAIDKQLKSTEIEKAENAKDAALYKVHFEFPTGLSLYIGAEDINKVKDGMTYGVVDVTYKATLEMIPSLTEEEKSQIYAWLIEAREFAMDAENSNKKHGVFGKYKGRINNYLSARGYDLTKEREEWYKRIKQQEAKK